MFNDSTNICYIIARYTVICIYVQWIIYLFYEVVYLEDYKYQINQYIFITNSQMILLGMYYLIVHT